MSYNFNLDTSGFSEFFSVFFSVYMGILLFFLLAVFIVEYIFYGLSLSEMAKRRGVSAPYTAWIPFANFFLMGKLAEQFELAQYGKTRNHKIRLVVTGSISYALLIVFFIAFISLFTNLIGNMSMLIEEEEVSGSMMAGTLTGVVSMWLVMIPMMVASILFAFFSAMALYKLFRSQNPRTCVLFTILSLVVNPFACFALFAQRKRDDGFIELNDKYARANEGQAGYERL